MKKKAGQHLSKTADFSQEEGGASTSKPMTVRAEREEVQEGQSSRRPRRREWEMGVGMPCGAFTPVHKSLRSLLALTL